MEFSWHHAHVECRVGTVGCAARDQAREQAGRPDGGAAEPAGRPVDGAVGLGPAALAAPRGPAAGGPARAGTSPSTRTPTSRIRARCSPSAVEEPGRRPVDLHGHVGRLGQGAGPGDRGEVGEPHGEGDRPSGDARHPHPATHLVGQPQHLADAPPRGRRCRGRRSPGPPSIVGVGRPEPAEGAPVAGGDRAPVGRRRPARGGAAEVVAERALQGGGRGPGEVADREQAEPVEHRRGLLAHAVELADVERVEEVAGPVGRDDHHPVGLGPAAGRAWRPRAPPPPRPSR